MASTAAPESVQDIRDFNNGRSGTDDCAIYMDDTFDEKTVKRLGTSPSAAAILSPAKKWEAEGEESQDAGNSLFGRPSASASAKKAAKHHAPQRTFAVDVTNYQGVALFQKGNATPQPSRNAAAAAPPSTATLPDPYEVQRASSVPTSAASTPPSQSAQCTPTHQRQSRTSSNLFDAGFGSAATTTTVKMVPLSEYEQLEKQLRKFERMYFHQRSMADLADKRTEDAQQKLQEKIIEVVALSTRNEESKRFIRQLKKEMLDCKTRSLALHNKAVMERSAEDELSHFKKKLTHMLDAEREEFAERSIEYERKINSLERLVADLMSVKEGGASMESLLKASYTKSHSLYQELRRVRGEYEHLVDAKMEAERHADMMRRELRDVQTQFANDRRRMSDAQDQHEDDMADMQATVVELRQDLMEALARGGSVSPTSATSSEGHGDNHDDYEMAGAAHLQSTNDYTLHSAPDNMLGSFHRDTSQERHQAPIAANNKEMNEAQQRQLPLPPTSTLRNPLQGPQ